MLCAMGTLLLTSVCPGQTLALTVAPSTLTIYPGQQGVPLTITVGSSAWSGPIDIVLTGLPSGIAASPLALMAGSSGTLMLNASVAAGQEGFSNMNLPIPSSWTASAMVVGTGGPVFATAQLSVTVSISNPSYAPAPSAINLPIVSINTGGVPIVSKTVDVPGTITITSADTVTPYLPNASDNDNTASFHVRGNSTAAMPKLPYHISLNTSLDLLHTMGLQCPYVTNTKGNAACDKSKHYVLLANYDDKTLMRTWAAAQLANAIPIGNGFLNSPADSPTPSGTSVLMPWAPHSLFVELYVNGQYEGNYQLGEDITIDSHRVNIDELAETDTAPSQVTGGYLLDIDANAGLGDYVFDTPKGLPIELVDPDYSPDPNVPEQTSYISSYVGAAETALFSSNFTDPTQGWRAYFDEASAINFYLVQELMGNADIFINSNYLYKNDNNPLIYMGPVWDFDVSSGNANYVAVINPTVEWGRTQGFWYGQWFSDPGFNADAVTQWNTLKSTGVLTKWLASIQQQAQNLQQSQVNNFQRWPMLGIEVWPNNEAAGSYAGEVAYLMDWLNLRIAYVDSLFNSKPQPAVMFETDVPKPAGRNADRPWRSGLEVTLTAHVSGGASPTGLVTFLSNGIILGTASLNASGTATVTLNNFPAGANNLQAVYNGDGNNAFSVSASQVVRVAAPLQSRPF